MERVDIPYAKLDLETHPVQVHCHKEKLLYIYSLQHVSNSEGFLNYLSFNVKRHFDLREALSAEEMLIKSVTVSMLNT